MFSSALSLYAVYLTLDTSNIASPANMPGLAAGLAVAFHSFAGVKLPVPDMFVSGMLLGVLAQQASVRSGMMIVQGEKDTRGYERSGWTDEQQGDDNL